MSAEFLTLLLADGRLPTGAHTQSAGVEPALADGLRLDQVPAYVSVRLRTVTLVEAAAAVVARHVVLAGDPDLSAVDAAWRARTASDALRDASDLLGRSYLRTAASVWDLSALTADRRVWCRAVVVGATAAAAGLGAAATARLVAYEDVQTVVAAALKLRPFDPSVAVRWVADAAPAVEALVARAAPMTTTAELPAYAAPQIEHWAQRHAHAERRLFRA